jgi:LPS-assembly lipoprotein
MSRGGWSISWSAERRALLAALPHLGALAGCGFRPIYADSAPGAAAETAAGDLAATRVGVIADREGQLLRRALQRRLGSDRGAPARYSLAVTLEIRREQVAVRPDQTETRNRITGTAAYELRALSPASAEPIARGKVRAVYSFNVGRDQFFAAQLSGEAALERIAEQLATDIAGQLAAAFARRRAVAAQGS